MRLAFASRRRIVHQLNFLCVGTETGAEAECTVNANGLAKTLFLLLSLRANRILAVPAVNA